MARRFGAHTTGVKYEELDRINSKTIPLICDQKIISVAQTHFAGLLQLSAQVNFYDEVYF